VLSHESNCLSRAHNSGYRQSSPGQSRASLPVRQDGEAVGHVGGDGEEGAVGIGAVAQPATVLQAATATQTGGETRVERLVFMASEVQKGREHRDTADVPS
jgi:hypothetical protein